MRILAVALLLGATALLACPAPRSAPPAIPATMPSPGAAPVQTVSGNLATRSGAPDVNVGERLQSLGVAETRTHSGAVASDAPPARATVSPTRAVARPVKFLPAITSGLASTYGPGYSEWWVAIPQGPGWHVRVCGAGGCRTLLSTDLGPAKFEQRAGRIIDLPVGAFAAVCGEPWTVGLCRVWTEVWR